MRHCLILLSILLSLLCSCALQSGQVCKKNGKPYGETIGIFQGQWDDYYERALSYMEGECYEAALSDLNQALEQKFTDKRMERTYGMHFIDYFPHREKGLIHYLRGEYEIAGTELEISLLHEPSEKALYYLDEIRKRAMELEKQIASVPDLMIKLPPGITEGPGKIRTRDDPIVISGIAEDRQYVSEIVLAGKPLFIEASEQRVEFQEELKLDQGTHEFDIIAKNLMKGELKRRIIIHVDRSGPVIALEKFDAGSGIQGSLYDESGVISFVADGKNISIQEDKEVFFSIPANSDTKHMSLVAADRLGNETRARVDTDTLFSPLLAARNLEMLEMTDTGKSPAMLLCSQTGKKPVIKLNGLSERETCFLEKISIKGQVKSEPAIKSLVINSTPILWEPGRMIFFNHSISLKKWENKIEIRAEDEAGNTDVKEIFITRQIPKAFQLKYRYSIFIRPFSNIEQNTGLEMFQHFFLQNFAEQNRFQVMAEDGLKSSRSRLSGAVYETRNGIEIIARLIDNNTSEVLAVKDVYNEHDESGDHVILKQLADRLAEKFHRELPLADGILVEIDGKKLIADFGNKKLKIGWPLVLYRLENPGEKSLFIMLGSDTEIIGSASIDEFTEQNYGAVLEENVSKISKDDRIISQ